VKARTTFITITMALVVGTAPAAACLAMVHEAPVAERAHGGCDPTPDSPSTVLCPVSHMVIPADAPVTPTWAPGDFHAAAHPGAWITVSLLPVSKPPPFVPQARSAPIHLLHATFLI